MNIKIYVIKHLTKYRFKNKILNIYILKKKKQQTAVSKDNKTASNMYKINSLCVINSRHSDILFTIQ